MLIKSQHVQLLFWILLFAASAIAQPAATASGSKSSGYQMPADAVAAGVDGRLRVGLTITEEGKAKDVRVYGEPLWPCGTNPQSEVSDVKRTVKEYVLATKFTPEMKNGKPKSVSAQIVVALSNNFRLAIKIPIDSTANIADPTMIDVGLFKDQAISIPKVFVSREDPGGISQLQVVVDETGKVISAGAFGGASSVMTGTRISACDAKFTPQTFNGKPVKMTGIILYSGR